MLIIYRVTGRFVRSNSGGHFLGKIFALSTCNYGSVLMNPTFVAIFKESTLKPVLILFTAGLAVTTFSRLLLVTIYFDRVSQVNGFWPVMLGGLRMDLLFLAMAAFIPGVILPFFNTNSIASTIIKWAVAAWFTVAIVFMVFMESATPAFMHEFDKRPNRLFVEYLNSPHEVLSMIWLGYKWQLLVALLITAAAILFCRKLFRPATSTGRPTSIHGKFLLSAIALIVLILFGRSSLQHRPANPGSVAFSSDALVNSLPLSSGYSLAFSIYQMTHEEDISAYYGEMASEDVYATVIDRIKSSDFPDASRPTLHFQQATLSRERKMNLVIIIEESLGASFVESLGGLPLTPNFEQLKHESWWFNNMYATGVRSARGLEAIITGFPPTPARAVLKLPKSQEGFFTLAELLKRNGYASTFLYGGQADFDNMRGFFMNNGFDQVLDNADFEDPVFKGSWGVSDEDLFNKAHELLSSSTEQPSFLVAFSSSNHVPWEFPDGRIDLAIEPKAHLHNAVKYADYSVGHFFKLARNSDYWDNTIFVVVADHESRVYGANLVPVDKFHVPAFILGSDIKPRVDDRLASHIDLGPTLLSLLGISAYHPMIGRDLTRDHADDGPVLMQVGDYQAYLENDQVVILRPYTEALFFDWQDHSLIPLNNPDQSLGRKALAYALWTSMAYDKREYTLPELKEQNSPDQNSASE